MCNESANRGYIFDIQRFSVHDGPGIRTTIFLKGCQLRCYWCQNPESQNFSPEILLYKERCTKCGRCVEVCPTGASWLSENCSEIDRAKCKGCGKCVEVCLSNARKKAGIITSVEAVLDIVMKDLSFYNNSDGGVTLSGGEPLLQPDFAREILKKCKERGLHTAVETCGYVPWENIEHIMDNVDLFLFDIKHTDPLKHEIGTGKTNDIILNNAKKIATCKPLCVRVPLIPGFNDTPEVIRSIVDFAHTELGYVEIELLAYNKMGESKYEHLGRKPVTLDLQEEEYIKSLRDLIYS